MGQIIGIDLGTTTSEMAYLKNGRPEIIKDKKGESIFYSVAALLEDGKLVVGRDAKKQFFVKPEAAVAEVKRLMGRDINIILGNTAYMPQEISAAILKHLKKCAEEYLGEEVTEAVITVPAKFNNMQRQATKDAAAMAGLHVERIINEPTAAALAYGLENYDNEETILVYDLGGGTFDVSILEMFEGILDVKTSRGNNELGGKDFDERIMEYIFEVIEDQHGINLRKDLKAKTIIKEAAERAKINLSKVEKTSITIPIMKTYAEGILSYVHLELTRDYYEKLIADLIWETDRIVEDALKACHLTVEDIDVVIPVGGSTRNHCIVRYLANKFPGRVKTGIHPEEVVAKGAAVQAGIKSGKMAKDSDIIITDVCPYSLGVNVVEQLGNGKIISGIFDPIIKIDTTIPVTRQNIYKTVVDNQSHMTIEVYQGEDTLCINNKKIGTLTIDEIPKGPAGAEFAEIEFSYDLNGILNVKATVTSTGKEYFLAINTKTVSDKKIEESRRKLDNQVE